MFYAQNLKKKLDSDYKPYLKINKDCLFPYKFTKNNSTTLLHYSNIIINWKD